MLSIRNIGAGKMGQGGKELQGLMRQGSFELFLFKVYATAPIAMNLAFDLGEGTPLEPDSNSAVDFPKEAAYD